MEATFFNGHCDVEVGDWVRLHDEPPYFEPRMERVDDDEIVPPIKDRRPTLKPIEQIRVIQDVWREMDGTPGGELKTSVRFLFAIDGAWHRREEFEPVAYDGGEAGITEFWIDGERVQSSFEKLSGSAILAMLPQGKEKYQLFQGTPAGEPDRAISPNDVVCVVNGRFYSVPAATFGREVPP